MSDELALLQPRVALVGPPLANSGGIGRVMGYLLSALPAEAQPVVVLDTRGTSRHPALSGLTLLSVLLRLLLLRLRRCIDVVHVNISSHGSTMRKLPVVQLLHWLQIPCVLHLHASSYPEFYGTLSPWARRLVRRGFSLATRLIVLGEGWRIYAQNILGVDPSRITVIPNAVPGPALLDIQPRDASTFHIVFLGRLGQRKGTGCLIDAFAALPDDVDWCATLAGDGDVDTYRRMAAARGIAERITFPGWVDDEAAHAVLMTGHVLVLASQAEGLPMSVLEAMAYGIPPVVTAVGAVPEVIRDGVNGLLVPVDDPPALAAVLTALAHDEHLRVRLATNARASWQGGFTIELFASRVTDTWRAAATTRIA